MNQYKKDILRVIESFIDVREADVETLVLFHEKVSGAPQVVVTFSEGEYEDVTVLSKYLNLLDENVQLKDENKKLKAHNKSQLATEKDLDKTLRQLNSKVHKKAREIALGYLREDLDSELGRED